MFIFLICLVGIAYLMIGSVIAGIYQVVNHDKLEFWEDEDVACVQLFATIIWPMFLVMLVCCSITNGVKRILQKY